MSFILIVETNRVVADRASDILIAAGHACGWVATAEQAAALLRWRKPDLILLDEAVPGAAGGELAQVLRSAAGSPDLPIIMLTGDDVHSASPAPPDNSVLDHIRKPFDPRFLVWRVNHALEAHAGRPLLLGGEEYGTASHA